MHKYTIVKYKQRKWYTDLKYKHYDWYTDLKIKKIVLGTTGPCPVKCVCIKKLLLRIIFYYGVVEVVSLCDFYNIIINAPIFTFKAVI